MTEPATIIAIIFLSFIMESIDSGIGMMYGTLLSPLLIIIGFNPLVVVPSILLSQAIGGFAATFHHHKFKNASFGRGTADIKITALVIGVGVCALLLGVYAGGYIPTFWLKFYIGLLCIVMGTIIMIKRTFKFSWLKIAGLGIISSFNKSFTGGGFGPIMASGQIASGVEEKRAIGITDFAEAPICIISFAAWILINGFNDYTLMVPMCGGAFLGGLTGPYLLSKVKNKKVIKTAVGTLAIVSGIIVMLKLFGCLKI
ncbi:MAG: sulfite exporter TauE/SafE family protein [Candidatus Ratteibacteria bacterium]|jgi:hypothetical protein